MRTTLILKDDLVKKAMEPSSIKEKTALVHAGLEALIAKFAHARLIALGGSQKGVKGIKRRKVS